jgi:hypothetical protein
MNLETITRAIEFDSRRFTEGVSQAQRRLSRRETQPVRALRTSAPSNRRFAVIASKAPATKRRWLSEHPLEEV